MTSEQANEILERAKELNPAQKAEILEELEKEISPEEIKEKEEAREKFQETISQYEEAIDNLVEKANNLGIKISAEQLRVHLENLRNIEPAVGEKWSG